MAPNLYFALSSGGRSGIHHCRDAKNGNYLRYQQCTLHSVPPEDINGCVLHLNSERNGLLILRTYPPERTMNPTFSAFRSECRLLLRTYIQLLYKVQVASTMDASCTNFCTHWVSAIHVFHRFVLRSDRERYLDHRFLPRTITARSRLVCSS